MLQFTTQLFFATVLFAGLFACSKRGCTDPNASNYNPAAQKNNGKCVYTPGIKLIGDATLHLPVGGELIDEGAIALDVDGSKPSVAVVNMVNTAKKGNYTIQYSAQLKSGEVTTTRNVVVAFDRSNWVGTWKRSSDCELLFPDSLVTFVLGEQNNQIQTTDMFDNFSPGTFIYAIIDKQHISIPEHYLQQNMWNSYFSATGEMNDEANAFKLKVNYFNQNFGGSPFGGQFTCSLKYTKVQ